VMSRENAKQPSRRPFVFPWLIASAWPAGSAGRRDALQNAPRAPELCVSVSLWLTLV
jgi:hypothetical protein